MRIDDLNRLIEIVVTYYNAIKFLIEESPKLFNGKDAFVLLFKVSEVDDSRNRHAHGLSVNIGKIIRNFRRYLVLK